ncbi:hypothetical protein [Aureitalea marina]|uniref:Sensor of ECF-type sigma factor n=1 Tax=Aureitalea marina TaxID=930804 RepID=A0A2S7KPQ2_9FLAO|nr:hypothetical protein [Aureitalea marina]PQB04602.1 hypothetical protein BST85_06600 [Aureitalea marina]
MNRLMILLLLIGFSSLAQNGRGERIRAYKTAFITDKLDLSSEEAERFWPVYNKYQDQLEEIRKEERQEISSVVSDLENLSEDEANYLIDKGLEYSKRRVDVQALMVDELRVVISPKKVLKLRRVEESFKREMLNRFRDNKRKKN